MKNVYLFSARSATFYLRIIFFSVCFCICFTLQNQYLRLELWVCSLFPFVINSNSHIHVYNTFWSHLFPFFLLPLLQSSSHSVNNPHRFSIWFVLFYLFVLLLTRFNSGHTIKHEYRVIHWCTDNSPLTTPH